MNTLTEWAQAWSVRPDALADLTRRLGALDAPLPPAEVGRSEAAVQARVRVAASALGWRCWRNNVGAGFNESGQFLRWGLANDSTQVNARIKSADLIGIRPRLIGPSDIGTVIGQFLSLEVKHEGWRFSAAVERERAQRNWAALVTSLGGDARFVTSESSL